MLSAENQYCSIWIVVAPEELYGGRHGNYAIIFRERPPVKLWPSVLSYWQSLLPPAKTCTLRMQEASIRNVIDRSSANSSGDPMVLSRHPSGPRRIDSNCSRARHPQYRARRMSPLSRCRCWGRSATTTDTNLSIELKYSHITMELWNPR